MFFLTNSLCLFTLLQLSNTPPDASWGCIRFLVSMIPSFPFGCLINKAKAPMSTLEGASLKFYSPFPKLAGGCIFCHLNWQTFVQTSKYSCISFEVSLQHFFVSASAWLSTKLWGWQFRRSAPIELIMSSSFDSLPTWQTKLASDKWSSDKERKSSTHFRQDFAEWKGY